MLSMLERFFSFNKPMHIGKYTIVREVGFGATSNVYLALNKETMATVALKVLNSKCHSPAHMKMFEVESSLCGKLIHPNIVELITHGVDETPYIVMEFIDGVSLDKHEDRYSLMWEKDVTKAMLQVAEGLKYASDKGVLHLDLKPGNIFRTKTGEFKVADFGCALVEDASTHLGVAGSLPYMSPEQIKGLPLTVQSDIYSLGCVFYKLLTGYYPYLPDSEDTHEYAHKVLHKEYVPLSVYSVDDKFNTVVDKMLQKDLKKRYNTWDAFIVDAKALL